MTVNSLDVSFQKYSAYTGSCVSTSLFITYCLLFCTLSSSHKAVSVVGIPYGHTHGCVAVHWRMDHPLFVQSSAQGYLGRSQPCCYEQRCSQHPSPPGCIHVGKHHCGSHSFLQVKLLFWRICAPKSLLPSFEFWKSIYIFLTSLLEYNCFTMVC